ncbi:MAG: tetraacyldisaccharide 4'-kinase [Candidatus Coatesbacteria bacterium]|nr:MAG: tetraacyldisaccharide 4'-kinase [Candidatus Coatesbacteria bacterium]
MSPASSYEPFYRRLTEGPVRCLLWPFGRVWGLVAAVRRWAYSSDGPLEPKRLPVPVISVGNVAMGGTGKSSFVVYLVRLIQTTGRSVAILSRGYGRASGGTVVVSKPGSGLLVPPEASGDEPAMFGRALPDVFIVVGSDRYSAGLVAVEEGAEVVVLDDGFQHVQLARDLDVVLVDTSGPPEWPFPAGLAREDVDALFYANVVCFSKANIGKYMDVWVEVVDKYARNAVKLTAGHYPTDVRDLGDDRPLSLAEIGGKRVLALAGVGDFGGFISTLEEVGAVVAVRRPFPDHHLYSKGELEATERSAFAADCVAIVTTAKDEARIGEWKSRVPVYVLDVITEVTAGEPELEGALLRVLGDTLHR